MYLILLEIDPIKMCAYSKFVCDMAYNILSVYELYLLSQVCHM